MVIQVLGFRVVYRKMSRFLVQGLVSVRLCG